MLRKASDRNWSDLLVDLFGQADGGTAYSPSQLAAAEAWLRDHPDNPVLLLTLGRLAARNQMPSKARRYYEMSIAQSPHPVTYRELGRFIRLFSSATDIHRHNSSTAIPASAVEYQKKGQAGRAVETGRAVLCPATVGSKLE